MASPTLMGIPREVRDKIYEETFAWEYPTDSPPYAFIPFPSLNLVRVSKQAHEESIDVLLRCNQFLHIRTNLARSLFDLFKDLQVAVIYATRTTREAEIITGFAHYILTMDIIDDQYTEQTDHMLIVSQQRNAESVVRAIAYFNCHKRQTFGPNHDLTIIISLHDPFYNAARVRIFHDEILDAVTKHWWSFRKFTLRGYPDVTATEAFETRIRSNRYSSPQQLVAEHLARARGAKALLDAPAQADEPCSAVKERYDRVQKLIEESRQILTHSLGYDEGVHLRAKTNILTEIQYPVVLHHMLSAEIGVRLAQQIIDTTDPTVDDPLQDAATQAHDALSELYHAIGDHEDVPQQLRGSEHAHLLYLRAVAARLRGWRGDLDRARQDIARAADEARGECADDDEILTRIRRETAVLRDAQEDPQAKHVYTGIQFGIFGGQNWEWRRLYRWNCKLEAETVQDGASIFGGPPLQ